MKFSVISGIIPDRELILFWWILTHPPESSSKYRAMFVASSPLFPLQVEIPGPPRWVGLVTIVQVVGFFAIDFNASRG